MKKLSDFLNKSLRIIEFSRKTNILTQDNIKLYNYLSIINKNNSTDSQTVYLNGKSFITAIYKNSTDVIILNCAGWNEIKVLKANKTKYVFVRVTLLNFIFVLYFLSKSIISSRNAFQGLFYLRRGIRFSLYIGFRKRRKIKRVTRNFLSPIIGLESFFKELNRKNISYCVLRWFENLPIIEENEDVDLLVDDDDLSKVYSIIDKKPGIIPFDIYSKSGLSGSDYKNLPYYVYSLAEKILDNTILFKNNFKVPTWENYFYLLAYHVVFHKGENSGLQSNLYNVIPATKLDHDYIYHLKTISNKANINIDEFTLEGLHKFLENKQYVPPLDTQYKLSLNNQYLKAYLEDVNRQADVLKSFEGLVCFVIREKIIEKELLGEVEKFIQKEGFTVIRIEKIKASLIDAFTKQVRGGNWNQGPWPSNAGKPSVLIIAFDVYPIKPDSFDHLQHPGLTNKRILNKNEIRNYINKQFLDKTEWCNGVHSSDNEIQAVEYLTLAGANKNEIREEIIRFRQEFETQHPVLEVLSSFSRRAKVELISYQGKKAIQKTFKPGCEWFLANEIEAYTVFQDLEEVPKLIEKGDNYFIVSYVEGSKQLGNRIDVRTLRKCINLLRIIYDKGYSLFDFKPSNFLIDKNKRIYIIDFEFLHKYTDKPSFSECYDLVGVPENFDLLNRPIIKIPKGKKQFDVKWGGFTGIKYNELLNLDNPFIHFKSMYRYYKVKIRKLLRLMQKKSKREIKVILKTLP